MKAIVICGASLRLTPYAFGYLDELLAQKADVTVFVWIRNGQEDVHPNENVRILHYNRLLDDAAPKVKKVGAFIGFRNAVLKELRSNHYDFMVVLDTQFAVLFSDVLLGEYRGRFIYDMRDPSYEKYTFYRNQVAKVVDASLGVFISSDGYRKYLPKSEKIYTTHNIKKSDLNYCGIRNKIERDVRPIRISFWGSVRDRELNERLIDMLGNDERFFLQYFGTMSTDSEKLIKYCREHSIRNVRFSGQYQPEDRYDFALNTEMIHNIYPNDRSNYFENNPCLSNKYYDGIIFRIPQICLRDGFPSIMINKYGVGCSVDIDGAIGNALWDYYQSINWNVFNKACEFALNKAVLEYDEARNMLSKIVKCRAAYN